MPVRAAVRNSRPVGGIDGGTQQRLELLLVDEPDVRRGLDAGLVAVEGEVSVKGRRRPEALCRAWARCRLVTEARYYAPPHRYYAPPHVARAVSRRDALAAREIAGRPAAEFIGDLNASNRSSARRCSRSRPTASRSSRCLTT
jgi:hypothetical protein